MLIKVWVQLAFSLSFFWSLLVLKLAKVVYSHSIVWKFSFVWLFANTLCFASSLLCEAVPHLDEINGLVIALQSFSPFFVLLIVLIPLFLCADGGFCMYDAPKKISIFFPDTFLFHFLFILFPQHFFPLLVVFIFFWEYSFSMVIDIEQCI